MPPARRSMASTRKRSQGLRRNRPRCRRSNRKAVFATCRPSLSDIKRTGGEIRKIGVPMLRDLQPCRHPDSLMTHDVIKKPPERRRAARTADHAAMQAYRHHLRRRLAFGIEHVEAVLEIGEELIAAAEPLRVDEAHVVGIETVGNNQMRPRRSLDPV